MPPVCDQPDIPLFDRRPHHSSVPTAIRAAGARSGGPGRPSGRRLGALPWTAASTLASWPRVGWVVGVVTLVAIVMGTGVVSPAVAQTTSAAPSSSASAGIDPFGPFIKEAAQRFGVPALWLRFVMAAESAGDPRAVSPKGAIGLMQIMPDTYARLRRSYGLGADPFQPRDNIMAGAAYLREMYDRYGSAGFLAAYNAGPGRYEDHLATGRPLPEETRLYLARLAPLIAGVQAARIATAPDPLAWTRAPLFVARIVSRTTGDKKSVAAVVDRSPESSSISAGLADVTALAPLSDGLFVRIIPQGRPR
ncbi:MAG TPA: lytic transglycosylase domain-containing protein [Stellaceae bacterium]|nr:lytic transglycosylase domain-containing protein [Stellaceae bacterium]